MIRYLTAEQVLFLHSRVIAETGGKHGVRDLGALLFALGRPRAAFEGKDLQPDLFAKAAGLLESLLKGRSFVDGSERSAIAAAAVFLRLNGQRLEAKNPDLATFTRACARAELSFEEIAGWLREHCEPVN
ncbi:MAG TPA: type II toxin-antitoxin system death-on-curing family toxin [Anaerolineaceae bacterium]|nr:type II toxin-antitoxin system death-on-curing family toxin [Anaerolineaceae bacterium]